MKKPMFRIAIAIVVTAASAWGSFALAAADPFYTSRFREGLAAAERGQHAEAVRNLRIACFGFLEEPVLAECLVRLGLSQAAVGDREGFSQSFRRLVEAEQLLGVFRDAELDPALLASYTRRVEELVPSSVRQGALELGLVETETRTGPIDDTTEGSVRERRRDLEAGARSNPGDPDWYRRLARLERENDRPKAALDAARQALELAPGDPTASCLAGWGAAELDRCRTAAVFLASCQPVDAQLRWLATRCSVGEEQWEEARRWARDLEPAQRSRPEVQAVLAEIDDQGTAAGPAEETAGDPAVGPVSRPADPSSRSGPPVDASEAPRAVPSGDDIDSIRRDLGEASSLGELNSLYERVRTVLESAGGDNRESQFLAAEIAYRASRWDDAVRHFDRGGDPGDENPRLLFYLAISRYESGDRSGARSALSRCIDRLNKTSFVERYRSAILGDP